MGKDPLHPRTQKHKHPGSTRGISGPRAYSSYRPGLASSRLDAAAIRENFDEIKTVLDHRSATIDADRCFFCHDAPCITACPTGIDIPLFIRQISTDNPLGAARTIFDANIMGGMCARVCPTETLCEEACVRETSEGKPVKIGALQRFATDYATGLGKRFFERGKPTGKRIAVVGAGPASLSCAHELARFGHESVIFEAQDKPGGLNEFGIAAYKTINNFAAHEVEYILGIGGIDVQYGKRLGSNLDIADLQRDYDAVFLGIGLGSNAPLGIDGEDLEGVEDAVAFIARLRQTQDLQTLPVGREVVVIGGGMTAIDVAVQVKRLGAEVVTVVYRRGPEQAKASWHEQEVARTSGVNFRFHASPDACLGLDGRLSEVRFCRNDPESAKLLDDTFTLPADQLFRAIGQRLRDADLAGCTTHLGRIPVDQDRKTQIAGIWAGGDCIEGNNLTVTAVEDGKIAARAIHRQWG